MPIVLLLNPYVDAILCLALAFLIVGIMESLAPFLEKIPWVGTTIANAARGMAQAISHACGVAVQGITHLIGVSFHGIARFVDHTYHQFRSHALAILETVTLVAIVVNAVHLLKALVHRLTTTHDGTAARVKTLEKEYHGIERELKKLQHDVANGIGDDVLPRIKRVEKELHRVTSRTIPAIEAAEGETSNSLSDLWDWTKRNVAVPGTAVFTGAVAFALSALGLGWLRCNSNPFNNNKNACGLWGDLSSLLGLATLAIAAADFEELVKEAQSLEEEAVGAIKTLWNL